MEDNRDHRPPPRASNGRSWTTSFSILGVILIAVLLGYVYHNEPVLDRQDYKARTEWILSTTPLIDGHNDLPYLIRLELQNQIYDTEKFRFRDALASHTDLQRMNAGRLGGQFWSVFVECAEIKDGDDPTHSVRDSELPAKPDRDNEGALM